MQGEHGRCDSPGTRVGSGGSGRRVGEEIGPLQKSISPPDGLLGFTIMFLFDKRIL